MASLIMSLSNITSLPSLLSIKRHLWRVPDAAGVLLRLHPLGQHQREEDGEAEDEQVPGGVQVHKLQVGEANLE